MAALATSPIALIQSKKSAQAIVLMCTNTAGLFKLIMTDSSLQLKHSSRIFSALLFLLPALALTTRLSVGFIEATLLLGAIFYFSQLWRQRVPLFQSTRWIVIAFASNLLVAIASMLWFGTKASTIDNPTRQLLVVTAIGLIVLTKPKTEWFWYGLFTGAFGACAIALYQCFELGWPRAGGFHHIIMFGGIAMAMGLMSLASIGIFAGTRLSLLPYLAFLSGLAASLLSGSRGCWIALPLAFIPLYLYGQRSAYRKILAVGGAAAALLTAAYLLPQLPMAKRLDAVSTEISQYQLGHSDTSVGARLEMWKGAWQIFADHPLFGVGRANYNLALNKQIANGEISKSVQSYRHAHNEMLHALATGGIIGGLALALLYAAPFVFFMRHLRRAAEAQPYAVAGLILVLSFAAFGLTQVLFSHHIGAVFYAASVSVLAGICVMLQRASLDSEALVRSKPLLDQQSAIPPA